VSREALDDHFGANWMNRDQRLEAFREHRSNIEQMLKLKYLSWPVEESGAVLLKTTDVPKLRRTPARLSR